MHAPPHKKPWRMGGCNTPNASSAPCQALPKVQVLQQEAPGMSPPPPMTPQYP